jgi:hypothetical protein
MRALALSLALLAAAPATASAAFGEVEPLALRGDESCATATGLPGVLAVPAKGGVQFLQATREGLKPGVTVALGEQFYECSHVVSRPNGAAVIAGRAGYDGGIRIVVREAGGAWGTPVTIPTEDGWGAEQISAAVSDRGDVLVVWREGRSRSARSSNYRFRAVRRAPGAAFGAVETIGTPDVRNELAMPAIAATGEAFVLTTRVEGDKVPYRAPVSVFSAAPDGPFGAPVVIGTMPWLSFPAIVAGPDGRVLVALSDGQSVLVAEREPGGAFGPAAPVAAAPAKAWMFTIARIGATGEAAVAWVHAIGTNAGLVTRAAPGPFGSSQALRSSPLLPTGTDPFFFSQAYLSSFFGPGGLTWSGTPSGALTLTPDLRAHFAWAVNQPAPSAPSLISTPLAGGPLTSQVGGRGLVTPEAFPVGLADGTAGMAWTEAPDESSLSGDETRRYVLRFAAEGVAPRPEPAAPRVTVGAPRSRVLSESGKLRLPVHCSRPCEVRGEITAGAGNTTDTLRLPRGGRGTLSIRGAAFALAGPRGRLKVELAYRAPGASQAKTRTLRIAVRRPAGAPDTRVRKLRAVRSGDDIRVTWTIAGRPGDDAGFVVTGSTTPDPAEEPTELKILEGDKGERTFTITLRQSKDARFVTVRSSESLVAGKPTTVRVR